MKRGSTLFLKFVVILIGVAVLAWMVWFPPQEGRSVGQDLFTIYFKDAFLWYGYIASLPFFFSLYQAFKLLGYIEQNKAFTQRAVNALRNIKYCVLAVIAFIITGVTFIALTSKDDFAGFVALGMYVTFLSAVFATGVGVAQRLLQNAVDIKSENDFTV